MHPRTLIAAARIELAAAVSRKAVRAASTVLPNRSKIESGVGSHSFGHRPDELRLWTAAAPASPRPCARDGVHSLSDQ